MSLWSGAAAQNTVKLTVSPADSAPERRGNVSDVVAWLAPQDHAAELQTLTPKIATLVQKGKRFHPHLLVLPAGSSVDFPNQDPIFHNVFSLFNGKRFDLGLYEAGESRRVRFDREGVSYIFCNIHPQMSAIIVTLRTPYFGVSDSKGTITIQNVPNGIYELHVFAEGLNAKTLEKLTRKLSIPAQTENVVINLPLRATNLTHKNKYGRDYDQQPSDAYEK